MTTEETQLQDSTGLPLTISDEDAAAELRGDIIADEVDAAPVKKTKATVPAKAAEPPPDDDVDEVDEDLVKKVLAGQGEDDGDEERRRCTRMCEADIPATCGSSSHRVWLCCSHAVGDGR